MLHPGRWVVRWQSSKSPAAAPGGGRTASTGEAFVWPSSFAPESRFLAARKEGVQDTFVKTSKFSKNVRVTFRQRY